MSAVVTFTVAFLFGIQVALLTVYIRSVKRGTQRALHASSLSVLGMMSGFFGIGCAACGSIIATSLLTTVGASWLLVYLPLHGNEFGLIGISLLLYAIVVLLRKLKQPFVCSV